MLLRGLGGSVDRGGTKKVEQLFKRFDIGWLQCAVLAHNLIRWTAILGDIRIQNQLIVARTIRTRHLAVPGRLVNRSGRRNLRMPTNWPTGPTYTTALNTLRQLRPAPARTRARRSSAPHTNTKR